MQDNQKIQGKCGGYCGRCSPDPHAGLKLDVVWWFISLKKSNNRFELALNLSFEVERKGGVR